MSITYSDDQCAALEAFGKFLKTTEPFFSLIGSAGTGKSTIVEQMLQLIREETFARKPLLCATTHKASANLREVTGEDVRTIHSLLGARMVRDFTTGEEYIAITQAAIKKSKFSGTILICDESSMLGTTLLNAIKKLVKKVNVKVVFVGDSCQLSAVGEKQSEAVDKLTCPWHLSELTTVHRQAKENPVLALATEIREGRGDLSKFEQALNGGIGIHVLSSDDWKHRAVEQTKNAEMNNRVLTYTNNYSDRVNKAVRQAAHGKNIPPYVKNEIVVSNARVAEGDEAIIENNEELKITGVTDSGGGFYQITALNNFGNEVQCLGMSSLEARNKHLNELAASAKDDSNAFTWKEFYEVKDSIADLRPAHAGTVYKAQGSTYNDSYINLKELSRCFNPEEHRRLLYVALTRASQSVYVTQ